MEKTLLFSENTNKEQEKNINDKNNKKKKIII